MGSHPFSASHSNETHPLLLSFNLRLPVAWVWRGGAKRMISHSTAKLQAPSPHHPLFVVAGNPDPGTFYTLLPPNGTVFLSPALSQKGVLSRSLPASYIARGCWCECLKLIVHEDFLYWRFPVDDVRYWTDWKFPMVDGVGAGRIR